jgi:hypothetical protein
VKLPAKVVLEVIKEIEDLKEGLIFLNLTEFLQSQILLKIDTMVAMIAIWH